MADLSTVVVRSSGVSQLMQSVPTLLVNLAGENVRVLQPAVTFNFTPLLPAQLAEAMRLSANTVSADPGNSGNVTFSAGDQSLVTSYEARLRVNGSSTISATQNLGKPTPDGNGVIIVSILSTINGLAAGDYTVSVASIGPGGTTDSAVSNVFTVPFP